MEVSASNFLELFEARWLERWRTLARELEAAHPIQWEVWSHHRGPQAHTAGIELLCQKKGSTRQVYCLLDFTKLGSEPEIAAAELRWHAPQNFGERQVFPDAVALNTTNWETLQQTLEEWSALLGPLLLTSRPNPNMASFGAMPDELPCPEYPTATGHEPDFPVWASYLESLPGTLVLEPLAMGTPEGLESPPEFRKIAEKLLELEPSLSPEIARDFMAAPPLQLTDKFSIARPVHFAEPPDQVFGYTRTLRQRLAPFPGASEILSLSRVALSSEQALFMLGYWDYLKPGSQERFIFGQRRCEGWTFRQIPFDIGAWSRERFEKSRDETPPLPCFRDVQIPGLASANFLPPEPTVNLPRLEVQLESGRAQTFQVLRPGEMGRRACPTPPYIFFTRYSHHTPTSILEACIRWMSSNET